MPNASVTIVAAEKPGAPAQQAQAVAEIRNCHIPISNLQSTICNQSTIVNRECGNAVYLFNGNVSPP